MIDFYFACTGAAAYDLAVTHAAWCFTSNGSKLRTEISAALIEGYESLRPLERAERAALPVLAQGACLRFISSRAADWLEMQDEALVCRKNPVEFVKRLSQYSEMGSRAFQ